MRFLNNIVWFPTEYAEASVAAREASEEMLSRLSWMTLKPQVILDVGCGTGEASSRLQTYYPEAQVLAIDGSNSMIQYAKLHTTGFSCVCANAEKLPLSNHSVDLIFANFLLSWHGDIPLLLKEWRRVLRPEGLVMVSALGPDTLKEYRGDIAVLPSLIDMHDLGDLLLQQGFIDPVLDVNYYTLTYQDSTRLTKELQASGMVLPGVNDAMSPEGGTWEATYEVIFAHAFAAMEKAEVPATNGIARIPVANLRRRFVKGGNEV